MHFLLLNGPNLNLLGTRKPEVYGSETLEDVEAAVAAEAALLGHTIESFQSNHEGALIDRLHRAKGIVDGVVFNPGAYTHTSYALHDAIEAIEVPTVEVHISNVMEREPWRRESRLRPACVHGIYGRGTSGYLWALRHLHHRVTTPPATLPYGPGDQHIGDLRVPDSPGPHPVVALVHGGFWRHQWTRDTLDGVAADLAASGFASWVPEYRRVGMGGGAVETADDVTRAIDHLADISHLYHLDLDRIAVLGHSAGGQLAVVTAGRTVLTPRAVVPVGAVLDLEAGIVEDLGDGAIGSYLGSEDPAAHSPVRSLPLGCPLLVVHGTDDDVVPVGQADAFVAAAEAVGDDVTYLRAEGVDHMGPVDPRSATWATVRDHLGGVLGRTGSSSEVGREPS